MSAQNDGGPAFPIAAPAMDPRGIPFNHIQGGMSLRDFFAATIVSGFISNKSIPYRFDEGDAEYAYMLADAMLRAREVTP